MTFQTVEAEITIQKQVKKQILENLAKNAEANPSQLVNSTAKHEAVPAYLVKRAVWSLLADGELVFTPENKVRRVNSR